MMPTQMMTPMLMPAFAPVISADDAGVAELDVVEIEAEVAGRVRADEELGKRVGVGVREVVLDFAADEDGDEDEDGDLEAVELSDGAEEVEIEKSIKADGAGAWNLLPLGWSQSTPPVEFEPQHCQRDVDVL